MALKDEIANLPTTVDEGNAGHLNNHQVLHAAAKAHESRLNTHDSRLNTHDSRLNTHDSRLNTHDSRLNTLDSRASITWSHEGTGTPTLSNYPGIKIGDYIVRKSDGQEWRVDA